MSVVRDVVEVLARALTSKPDEVRVVESQHKGTTLVELFVGPGELGKVIGKQGRTAAALRTLAATAAEKEGRPRSRSKFEMRQAVKWDDMAVVGRIARPHGIRGQVILNAETDFPEERFQPGRELFIERRRRVEPLTLTTVRFHQRPADRRGVRHRVDRRRPGTGGSRAAGAGRVGWSPLPAGTFYRHDLVGCRVETEHGRRSVGIVKDVDGTRDRQPARRDVGPRRDSDSARRRRFAATIDAEGKRIVIEPPEGLLELNRVKRREA